MATMYKLHDVSLLNGKNIFFDANVLIYLFWPTGSYYYELNYARAFNGLLRQGNGLYVDFTIISEIVNRVLRDELKRLQPGMKLKDFRDSPEGQQVLSDIYLIIKSNILSNFNIIGKAFSKNDVENFLVVDNMDFVDKATQQICKENDLVLLTNDKDFKNADLDILTGNPSILN